VTPSSQSNHSAELVLLCQRAGELAEFADILADLGVPVEIQNGPLPSLDQVARARLVIVSGPRLAEGKAPALRRWPRTIAVVDDNSRTLSAHLTRLGVSVIVRRPIHSRALRLLILHNLYCGPERRGKKRVMIGQPIRAGVGIFKQDATLLELSRTGARIEVASPPKVGASIQFVLGKELTNGKPLKIQAKVVRSIRAATTAGTTGEIGLAIVNPNGDHVRTLQAILDRYSNGAPPIANAGRPAPDASSPRPQLSPPSTATATSVRSAASTLPPQAAGTALRSIPTPALKPSAASSPARARPPVADPRPLPPSHSAPATPPAASVLPVSRVETTPTVETPLVPPLDLSLNLPLDQARIELEVVEDDLELLDDDGDGVDFELEDEIEIDIEGGDRRQSMRVPYTQTVVALDEQAARVVVGRDLSPGGMRIAPNPNLAVGDVLKLALHAGTETEPVVVLAEVERDDHEDGLVLAFQDPTSEQHDRIEKILAASSPILGGDPDGDDVDGESLVIGEVLKRVACGPSDQASSGFTLIELMIVVAIIGIISSVAIPLFGRYQLRTKSTEVKTNLSAIRVVQEAHHSEHGIYLAANAEPPLIPGSVPVEFDIVGSDYAEIGWSPEGRVYFSYAVAVSPDATGYTADAAADIDGNGILQIWGYSKPDPLGALTTGGLGCNPAMLDREEIGSCTTGSPAF
jgi:prepilin-type N-terminal cleavage/methylation domain-containing protein